MSTILATVSGPEGTTQIFVDEPEHVYFTADADVDADGSGGNPHGDPWFQPDTTLHHGGKALNAEKVPFIVVPPVIRQKTKGIVMGCQAKITNKKNGKSCMAVVGDIGPRTKTGELSCEAARRVGLSGNPNTGGTDERIIIYELWPGQAAVVDGIDYDLMPA